MPRWIERDAGRAHGCALRWARANRELAQRGVGGKHAEDYVAVIERAKLERQPPGCDALEAWIHRAGIVLGKVLRGEAAE